MTYLSPYDDNEHQWSVNNIWSCIFGHWVIESKLELIPAPLTALIANNTKYETKIMDSKIIDIGNCKTYKQGLLDVEWVILITYCYQITKTRALYESTNGLTRLFADTPSNIDKLEDFCHTDSEFTIELYSQPERRIGHQVDFDPDLNPNWWSRTCSATIDIYSILSIYSNI